MDLRPIRVPLTAIVVAALAFTTVTRRIVGDDRLERYASTNLDNLATHPVRSLALSAVVLEPGQWLMQTAGAVGALGILERRVGTRRAVALAVAGHVVPTVLTQAGVLAGVRTGRLPEAARRHIDVGASYVIATAVGALTRRLPLRVRRSVSAAAVLGTAAEVARTRDAVAAGHGMAFAIGYLGGGAPAPCSRASQAL